MSEKEIVGTDIGAEAHAGLAFVGGKLVARAKYDGKQLDAEVIVSYDVAQVIDVLVDAAEKAVPGDQKFIAETVKTFLHGALSKAE